jgi:NAD kinase
MNTLAQPRFVVVTRKTRLQELVERFNTWPQAKFYLEHNDMDVSDYLDEHDVYQHRLATVERYLKPLGRYLSLDRLLLPSFRFSPNDIVIVLGQDGLVANTLKYLDGQPLVAINPDPARWDGILLPFTIEDLSEIAHQVLNAEATLTNVTFAEARNNEGQTLRAVNDLFIGPKSHTSARYKIQWNNRSETQSSSGIIVSTGMGSTGWFQSILAGAKAVMGASQHALEKGFAWDAERLQFAVREPFPSKTTGTELVFGEINAHNRLVLESHMPENGIVFSDGIEQDYLPFNAGTLLHVSLAEQKGRLVAY